MANLGQTEQRSRLSHTLGWSLNIILKKSQTLNPSLKLSKNVYCAVKPKLKIVRLKTYNFDASTDLFDFHKIFGQCPYKYNVLKSKALKLNIS